MNHRVVALLIGAVLLSGCSTTAMKGTPFYTGEYEVREETPSDRVNLWPLVYYRDPALSVLWPLLEFSPDHLAVRPVYSMYNRRDENPVYNVVWPIARFDTANQDYRIFPVYWGADHLTVFPVYWHKGDPFSGTGYNALFPLWIWNTESSGSTLHVMWPFYANYDYARRQGWHLWPLHGTTDYRGGNYYRYWAWPFVHTYANSERSGHAVVPLYCYEPETGTFISLPYSQWRSGDARYAVVPWLLSGKRVDGETQSTTLLAGLASWRTEAGEVERSHVLPLYMWEKDSVFYTLLFGHDQGSAYYATPLIGRYTDGTSGSWVFPFYRHKRYSSGGTAGSYLLLGRYRNGEHSQRHSFFPLFKYRHRKNHYRDELSRPLNVRNESQYLNYLLLGWNNAGRYYEFSQDADARVVSARWKANGFFPLWNHKADENLEDGRSLETSAYLGFLYDTRHEKQSGEKEHDYQRRRVLWRLYHHETLNGDKSTDVFPGITVDSYANGYYKCSVLWRLFRYEKDPADDSRKLDFLFIPLRR